MSKLVNGMVVAATIALAGCAGATHRQTETVGISSRFAADPIGVCENALYYAAADDMRTALHCANVLDIWQ